MNLIEVFEDTIDYTKQNKLTESKTSLHTFDEIKKSNDTTNKVIVLLSDTISAAVDFSNLGKTALLNMMLLLIMKKTMYLL